MGVETIIFTIIVIAAFAFFGYNLWRIYHYVMLGKPENRWDQIGQRLKQMIQIGLFQKKILRDKGAGIVHVLIFWGFLALLMPAAEAILEGLSGHRWNFSFLGPLYSVLTLLADFFAAFIVFAVIGALWRRFVLKVPRLQGSREEQIDATVVLAAIFVIVTSLLLMNAARITMDAEYAWAVRPFSHLLAAVISPAAAPTLFHITWWIHILMILAFMNYLPYSKHFHVVTSLPNVFFAEIPFPNRLKPIDFEAEGVEKFGALDIEDLTWKTLLDGYTCTHCGRCTSVCPANTTGKLLDPRAIIVQINQRTRERAPLLWAKQNGKAVDEQAWAAVEAKHLVSDYIPSEALWQCTTCGACMQECPVAIEHVPAIVELRRGQVMMEANFPYEAQTALNNLENNFTPWNFSPEERADWAEGLGVKTAAEDPQMEVLFWVGCAGSYDARAKKVSQAFAKLLQRAGVEFRILGTEERCTGDPARRIGNEYLADMLIKMNVETLNQYNVKKIVTICPHCYNTLKNEYPAFGGNYEVLHHTQLLQQLVAQGRLPVSAAQLDETIAYHDSCYLGRYGQEYEAPRQVLQSVAGSAVAEPQRTRDRSFCCGAGGGRMFMEETEGKRVNIERTEELLALNPSAIAVNCPFCMTMLTDGVKAKEKAETVKVQDVAEILLTAIEQSDNGAGASEEREKA